MGLTPSVHFLLLWWGWNPHALFGRSENEANTVLHELQPRWSPGAVEVSDPSGLLGSCREQGLTETLLYLSMKEWSQVKAYVFHPGDQGSDLCRDHTLVLVMGSFQAGFVNLPLKSEMGKRPD